MPSVTPHPDVLVPPLAAWSRLSHAWLLTAACPLQRCKLGHLCIAEVCFFPRHLERSLHFSDALLLSTHEIGFCVKKLFGEEEEEVDGLFQLCFPRLPSLEANC